MIEAAILEGRRLAHENRLEGKNLDELDELEDEEDEEFLQYYRYVTGESPCVVLMGTWLDLENMFCLYVPSNQRLAELSTLSTTSIYNQVYPLQKPDYAREVTEASQKSYIFVLLTSSLGTNTESSLLTSLWRDMAARFGDTKFCQIRADLCIEGYPERNTPTILVYKDGDIKKQIVTLKALNGQKTSLQDLEKVLLELGAVKHNDSRLTTSRQGEKEDRQRGGIRNASQHATVDDDDSDWD